MLTDVPEKNLRKSGTCVSPSFNDSTWVTKAQGNLSNWQSLWWQKWTQRYYTCPNPHVFCTWMPGKISQRQDHTSEHQHNRKHSPQSGICKLSRLGKWELQLSDTIGFWRKRLSFFSSSVGIFCSPVNHWQKIRQQLPER